MSHLPENLCVFRGNRTVTGRKLEKHGPKKFDLLCAAISNMHFAEIRTDTKRIVRLQHAIHVLDES
jgi:hypothetical protein